MKSRELQGTGLLYTSLNLALASAFFLARPLAARPACRPPVSRVMNARSGPGAPPGVVHHCQHRPPLCRPPGGLSGPGGESPSPPTSTTNCQIEMLICQLGASAKESAVKPGLLELPLAPFGLAQPWSFSGFDVLRLDFA